MKILFIFSMALGLMCVNAASIEKEEPLDFKKLTNDFEFIRSIPAKSIYEVAKLAPKFKHLNLKVIKFLREADEYQINKLIYAFADLANLTPKLFDTLKEISEETYQTIFRGFPLLADYSPVIKEYFNEATEEDIERVANALDNFLAVAPETLKALQTASDEDVTKFIEENLPEVSEYADDIIFVIRVIPTEVFYDIAKFSPNIKLALYDIADYLKNLPDKYIEKFEAFKNFDAKKLAKDVKEFIDNADEELKQVAKGAKYATEYTSDIYDFIKNVAIKLVERVVNLADKISELSLEEIENIQKNPDAYNNLFKQSKN